MPPPVEENPSEDQPRFQSNRGFTNLKSPASRAVLEGAIVGDESNYSEVSQSSPAATQPTESSLSSSTDATHMQSNKLMSALDSNTLSPLKYTSILEVEPVTVARNDSQEYISVCGTPPANATSTPVTIVANTPTAEYEPFDLQF